MIASQQKLERTCHLGNLHWLPATFEMSKRPWARGIRGRGWMLFDRRIRKWHRSRRLYGCRNDSDMPRTPPENLNKAAAAVADIAIPIDWRKCAYLTSQLPGDSPSTARLERRSQRQFQEIRLDRGTRSRGLLLRICPHTTPLSACFARMLHASLLMSLVGFPNGSVTNFPETLKLESMHSDTVLVYF
eukprot:scaffold7066_cov253-Pinguiococcus_pyrenoidosus.AAC.23